MMDFSVNVHSPLSPFTQLNDIMVESRGRPVEKTAQSCVSILKVLAGVSISCGKLRIMLNVQELRAWAPGRPQIGQGLPLRR